MRLFKLIKKIQPAAHYLMATTHTEGIESMARQSGVDPADLTVVGGDHAQVPRYLAAADLAMITRGVQMPACVANRASSPVKFAEYLASGTPVVMSDGIGDYSELAQRHNLGLVIPHDASDEWIEARLSKLLKDDPQSMRQLRARCRQLAIDELASARQLEKVTKLYSELSGVR
jgi:glycosyltransferase involved in cell wall biosynthesis